MSRRQLTDLVPPAENLSAERLSNVRERLREILRDEYPDVDTSPNSVFDDIVLRPLVHLVSGLEYAVECLFSDLDLRNVARGNICDCDFVISYLKNLGADASGIRPTISTVRLTFTTNDKKVISNSAQFLFQNNVVLNPFTVHPSPITLLPTHAFAENKSLNIRRLSIDGNGRFFADIPVYGPEQAFSETGASGETDIVSTSLSNITLVSPVIPVALPETVHGLLERTANVFPSSALTTRSSIVSFFTGKLGGLAGVSPVMPGDTEMTRGGENLFGVKRNAVDVFPRGKHPVKRSETVVELAKDTSQASDRWVGLLNTQHTPLRLRNVRKTDNTVLDYEIVGTSADRDSFPGLSAGFSRFEELGLVIPFTPSGLNDSDRIGVFADSFTDHREKGTDSSGSVSDVEIVLNGSYNGHIFSASGAQSLVFTGEPGQKFTVTNDYTGESVKGVTTTLVGGKYRLDTDSGDYPEAERWTRGLTVEFDPNNATNDFDGLVFRAKFRGTRARVVVEHDYDPLVDESANLVEHDALQSAFDVRVVDPKPVVVNKLEIFYRTAQGRFVNIGLAMDELEKYVNSTVYPDIIEDSRLADIMFFAGSAGVSAIGKTVEIRTTLAHKYSPDGRDENDPGAAAFWIREDLSGSQGDTTFKGLSVVDDPGEFVLDDRSLEGYAGPRNIQFLVDRKDIFLTEKRL